MNNTKLLILDRASFFGFLALAFFLADTIKESDYFWIAGTACTLVGGFLPLSAVKKNKNSCDIRQNGKSLRRNRNIHRLELELNGVREPDQ